MTPYADLPERCFWKSGVARADPLTVSGLYDAKFRLTETDRIATAGSCFTQYLAAPLRSRGYRVLDVEPPPPWLNEDTLRAHGFGIYSARYGNIYTARQLLQLAREALDGFTPADPVWQRKKRFFDAQRPGVDPTGMDSAEEVMFVRAAHLDRVRELFRRMTVFVFTLGLTEAWMYADATTVFPTAPGTVAGQWNPARYRFHNFRTAEVAHDLRAFRALVQQVNPHFRMILSVSPVGLAATALDAHVLSATTRSKAVLRAAADEVESGDEGVDYFPSYELIATPFSGAMFYKPGLREVTPEGVAAAMRMFFDQHPALVRPDEQEVAENPRDPVCEEQLLEAFGP
ncbi:MAG: GSCFA domain-containing protein [Pseudomonadota bacterium]